MKKKITKLILLEGDILSLSFGFRSTKHYLYDDSLRAKHKIDSNGAELISQVAKSVDYADLIKQARRLGINQTELINMLNNINQVAGLRLHRPYRNLFKWLPEMAGCYLAGVKPKLIARRYPANAWGITQACLRSVGLVSLAWFISLPLVDGSNIFNTANYIYYSGLAWCIIVVSLFGHEYVHSRLISYDLPKVMIQSGLKIGLVHGPIPTKNEIASSLLGPITGAVTALILGNVISGAAAVGVIVASLHLASWLPGFGDSWIVLKKLKPVSVAI